MKQILLLISFCLFCLVSTNAFSSGFVDGLGKFKSEPKDSLSFIKKQLLHEALKEIISKELESLNLDKTLFWDVYNQKLEDYLAPTLDKIRDKYPQENISAKQSARMAEELRYKRLELRRKFGGLSRIIVSYTIKKISRSVHEANTRFLQLNAKVNRSLLNKIYWRFIGAGEAGKYANIYIRPEVVLSDLTWKDLGVELESEFTTVVVKHWLEKIENMFLPFSERITIVDDILDAKLENYLYKESGSSSPINNSEFSNSIVVNLKIELRGIAEDPFLNSKNFRITGDLVAYKLDSKDVFTHLSIAKKEYKFKTDDPQKLSSKMASATYQFPLAKLEILKDNLSSNKRKSLSAEIIINSPKNMLYVYKLKKYLETKTVVFQPNISVSSFITEQAKLEIKYFGDNERFKSTLDSLTGREFSSGLSLDINTNESPYVINFTGSN